MTNPTLERAARAVDAWAFDPDNGGMLKEARQQMAFDTARAVLMAVRSTDADTWDAAENRLPHGGIWDQVGMDDVWEAMIDAILNDGEGE